MVDQPQSFAERRRLLLEQRAKERGETPPQEENKPKWTGQEWAPELVPEVESDRSAEDLDLDRVIESIDILDAYRVWCGKMTPDAKGRTEGIKISCPNPAHPDRNPSAWINTEKQVYHCAGCDEGGDKYDIAAFSMGFEDYKNHPQVFLKLRQRMAEDFGYTVRHLPGNQTVVIPPEPESNPQPEPEPEPVPEPQANVTPLYAYEDNPTEDTIYPALDWRQIIPEDTFLWSYMTETTHDNSPEEYHFWHGLMALGHACGRRVYLDDDPPVYSNLMVCLLGGTGIGKSTSRRWLNEVIDEVLPWNPAMQPPSGVKQVVASGSGEHLINAFIEEQADATTGTKSLQPVNGIVDFDEMSRIISVIKGQRSILKEVIMQLADSSRKVTAGSLTRGDKIALEPYCSITTTTQYRTVRELFDTADKGSGFLNRWIFIAGKPKERQAIGGKWAQYRVVLDEPKLRLKHIKAWGSVPKVVELDEEAYHEWERFFRSRLVPLADADDTDLLKRIDLWHKKLMLLFAINQRSTTITVDIVRRVELCTDYIVQCYSDLNKNIGISLNKEIVDEVLRHAKRHFSKTKRGVSMRDLIKYTARKNWTPKQLYESVDMLVKTEQLEIEPKAKGPGRPTVRYRVAGE